jgi:hypothetical protein
MPADLPAMAKAVAGKVAFGGEGWRCAYRETHMGPAVHAFVGTHDRVVTSVGFSQQQVPVCGQRECTQRALRVLA